MGQRPSSSAFARLRLLASLFVVVIAVWVTPQAANASFAVKSCGASSSLRTDAWARSMRPALDFLAEDWCTSTSGPSDWLADYSGGLSLRTPTTWTSPGPTTPTGVAASLTFTTPPGGTVVSIDYVRTLESATARWKTELVADDVFLEGCVTPQEDRCEGTVNTPDRRAFGPLVNTRELALRIVCDRPSCVYGLGPYSDAVVVLRSSTVTVEEHGLPSAGSPVASGLVGGWVGGGSAVAFAGSDQLGLRKVELLEGSAVVGFKGGACVDWSVRPCAEAEVGGGVGLEGSVSGAALGLAEGEHVLRTRATDAADNQALSAPVSVQIDTTAPVAQWVYGVDGESPLRKLSWALRAGGSPITAARVQVCTGQTLPAGDCHWISAPVDGPLTFDGGDRKQAVTAQLELTDAAGNVGLSSPFSYPRDAPPVDPPATTPQGPSGGGGGGGGTGPSLATTALRARFPKHLPRRAFLVRGSVRAGSAATVTIMAIGRNRSGKTVRTRVSMQPRKSGAFALRVRLPSGLVRRSKLRLTVVATPTKLYRRATLRRTLP